MGLFRRGARSADTRADTVEVSTQDTDPRSSVGPDPVTEQEPAMAGPRPVAGGPWDEAAVGTSVPRVDLGAVQVPGVPDMELRMEVDKASGIVSAVAVSLGGSVLQVQAFAAPRTDGIWDEIRDEIAESVRTQGGSVDDLPGPFGRELLARLPVRTADGRTGHRPARFIGVDGPRWFLRGVLTGRAAVDPEEARILEEVFADIVVVRGDDARPPRDLLALRMPGQDQTPATPDGTSFDPPTRGPEITEVR